MELLKDKIIRVDAIKAYGGVEVQLHSFFLTSALDGGEWSALRTGRSTPGKVSSIPLNRRLGGPQNRRIISVVTDISRIVQYE